MLHPLPLQIEMNCSAVSRRCETFPIQWCSRAPLPGDRGSVRVFAAPGEHTKNGSVRPTLAMVRSTHLSFSSKQLLLRRRSQLLILHLFHTPLRLYFLRNPALMGCHLSFCGVREPLCTDALNARGGCGPLEPGWLDRPIPGAPTTTCFFFYFRPNWWPRKWKFWKERIWPGGPSPGGIHRTAMSLKWRFFSSYHPQLSLQDVHSCPISCWLKSYLTAWEGEPAERPLIEFLARDITIPRCFPRLCMRQSGDKSQPR